tara:strand:+ start:493 stop:687 length:195 start_codon:yes stop_codon:yes gene_type:complete
MVDGAVNKTIKKLKNGDFKVVNTSYGIPVKYSKYSKLRKPRVVSRKFTFDASGYFVKHSIYRDS